MQNHLDHTVKSYMVDDAKGYTSPAGHAIVSIGI